MYSNWSTICWSTTCSFVNVVKLNLKKYIFSVNGVYFTLLICFHFSVIFIIQSYKLIGDTQHGKTRKRSVIMNLFPRRSPSAFIFCFVLALLWDWLLKYFSFRNELVSYLLMMMSWREFLKIRSRCQNL